MPRLGPAISEYLNSEYLTWYVAAAENPDGSRVRKRVRKCIYNREQHGGPDFPLHARAEKRAN